MGTTNRAKSGIRHGPGSSAKILKKKPRKRWENKVFWKMLRFWSPQKYQKHYKHLGKQGILLKSEFHVEAEIAKKLIKPMENGIFCRKERQAHGHPLASPRRGKKMGAAWRPWPGLAEAGLSGEKTMDSPKAGTRFFPPLRDIFFFPGEKNGFIYLIKSLYV